MPSWQIWFEYFLSCCSTGSLWLSVTSALCSIAVKLHFNHACTKAPDQQGIAACFGVLLGGVNPSIVLRSLHVSVGIRVCFRLQGKPPVPCP